MTEQFRDGVKKLLELAECGRVALMCAEQLYWRCHRRIISDYLSVKGHAITHIVGKRKIERHELTSFARAIDGELRYSASASLACVDVSLARV